jgi:NhaP-type Na+/H+ and K+/H+ antiporter
MNVNEKSVLIAWVVLAGAFAVVLAIGDIVGPPRPQTSIQ